MAKTKTTLAVKGMSCSSCVFHIDSVLKSYEGVEEVEVKLKDRKVVIQHDSDKVDVTKLIDVLGDEGYESTTT